MRMGIGMISEEGGGRTACKRGGEGVDAVHHDQPY